RRDPRRRERHGEGLDGRGRVPIFGRTVFPSVKDGGTVDFNRRQFIVFCGSAAATFTVGMSKDSQAGCGAPIPFVITVQASGAWDPTFLVDPVADNAAFTPFAGAQIMTVGQIRYAPQLNIQAMTAGPYMVGATPQDFFAKHGQKMIIFNGVDNATISHDVGPR